MPLDLHNDICPDMLGGTCDIYRMEKGTRGSTSGNRGLEAVKVASGYPCTIQAQASFSSFSEKYQMQQFAHNDFIVFGNKIEDYTPTHNDQIRNYVGHDGSADPRNYKVMAIIDGGGGGRHWYFGCDALDKVS